MHALLHSGREGVGGTVSLCLSALLGAPKSSRKSYLLKKKAMIYDNICTKPNQYKYIIQSPVCSTELPMTLCYEMSGQCHVMTRVITTETNIRIRSTTYD